MAFYCTDVNATVAEILSMVADRFALKKDQAEYTSSNRWREPSTSRY